MRYLLLTLVSSFLFYSFASAQKMPSIEQQKDLTGPVLTAPSTEVNGLLNSYLPLSRAQQLAKSKSPVTSLPPDQMPCLQSKGKSNMPVITGLVLNDHKPVPIPNAIPGKILPAR